MKSNKKLFLSALVLFSFSFANAQDDVEGCKDYPLFNRMPNFVIKECEEREFEAYQFQTGFSTEENDKTENVEGKRFYYYYELNDQKKDEGVVISALQIFRNFENAMKQDKGKIMGKIVESGNSYSFITYKTVKNNKEIWFWINATENNYTIYVVEREAMVQVIQSNEMWDALNKDGFIALDILFDTGKSTIKEESLPIIDQIYELMNSNESLNISIEGHTDNVGSPESNKTLSDARAKSVMNAIAAKGINKSRMTSVGWGQERPVADNRSEEGRAKNRRVELVKK
jgi:outer membrane protein OmpA-like peptidoglycan-associated protein